MIFIFSGPSGVGKSTIIAAIRQKRDFQFSVSYTSRNIREGEYNGVNRKRLFYRVWKIR